MPEASAEAPASEPAAAPEPAHGSSAGAAASKERDKAAAPEANGTTPLSLTDAIPAAKLRMAAATALSAAAVRATNLTVASRAITYAASSPPGDPDITKKSIEGAVARGACLCGVRDLLHDKLRHLKFPAS